MAAETPLTDETVVYELQTESGTEDKVAGRKKFRKPIHQKMSEPFVRIYHGDGSYEFVDPPMAPLRK